MQLPLPSAGRCQNRDQRMQVCRIERLGLSLVPATGPQRRGTLYCTRENANLRCHSPRVRPGPLFAAQMTFNGYVLQSALAQRAPRAWKAVL